MNLPVTALVPARDEEASLPLLLRELAASAPGVDALVVDNGSRDRTAEVAREHGAEVVAEPRPGYGRACQRGLRALARRGDPGRVVAFLDADDLRAPAQIAGLVAPLVRGEAELVRGRRVGEAGHGVHTHAAAGNAMVAMIFRGLYAAPVRDLGPFRAARLGDLLRLGLDDPAYGWNVQMDVRALRAGWRVREVPVAFRRRRVGRSKISGSWVGSLRAARGLLAALARELLRPG